MTIDEKIKQLEKTLAETNELLAEIKREKENKESVLAEYWNDINSGKELCYLDGYNDIRHGYLMAEYSDNNASYSNYPTKEYAEQAQKIKEFNDKLLAFKWCYDRDYTPDWNDHESSKYYVYYDNYLGEYDEDYISGMEMEEPMVYFSSKEIAQKCCDWLNEKLAHEELEEE